MRRPSVHRFPHCFLFIALACVGMARAATPVSDDTATFTVRPGELKLDRAQLVGEKIKRIINLSGNNPLNPSNPLIDPTTPTPDVGPVNLAGACVGSVAAPPSGIAENWLASIELDAATGACQLRADYTGTTLRVSDPPSNLPGTEGNADAYPVAPWSFMAPSPVGGKQQFSAGDTITLRLRAPTGAVIDMQIRFAQEGSTNRRLDVLSTTPVQ